MQIYSRIHARIHANKLLITTQSIKNLRNLVPRTSLLPVSLSRSVGADRREPWEQGWNLRTPAFAEINKRGFL